MKVLREALRMDNSKAFEMSDVNLLQVFTDAVIIQKTNSSLFFLMP